MNDHVIQSARSGKQNIAAGSMILVTSKETEIKLTKHIPAILKKLMNDYPDYFRAHKQYL